MSRWNPYDTVETIKKNSSSLYSCVWLRRGVVDKERRKLTRSDLTNGSGRKFTTTHCEYHDDDDCALNFAMDN